MVDGKTVFKEAKKVGELSLVGSLNVGCQVVQVASTAKFQVIPSL